MKAFKIFLYITSIVTAFASLSSCSKLDDQETNQISIISASIVQPTDEVVTKTSLAAGTGNPVSYPVIWSESDAIAVSSQSATAYATYILGSEAGSQSGTFFKISGTTPSGSVYSYYPASNVTGVSGSTYSVTIPAVQNYQEQSIGNGAFPMYASATNVANLVFNPLMAVLKLQLTSIEGQAVKRIIVTSDTENLSGKAQVNMSDGSISWTAGHKSVELYCGESGVTLSATPLTFHIAVPAAALKDYCVVVTATDGKGLGNRLNDKTFTAGCIKKMPVLDLNSSTALYPVYAEGLYMAEAYTVDDATWAPVNCGYENNFTYGKLFQWGRHDGSGYQESSASVYDEPVLQQSSSGTNPISASNEDASIFYRIDMSNNADGDWLITADDSRWNFTGSDKSSFDPCPAGWRLPVRNEFNSLKTNVSSSLTVDDMLGVYLSGSQEYSDSVPRVFFPFAGYRDAETGYCNERGVGGYYWCSSPYGPGGSNLYITSPNSATTSPRYRSLGTSVRCVQM